VLARILGCVGTGQAFAEDATLEPDAIGSTAQFFSELDRNAVIAPRLEAAGCDHCAVFSREQVHSLDEICDVVEQMVGELKRNSLPLLRAVGVDMLADWHSISKGEDPAMALARFRLRLGARTHSEDARSLLGITFGHDVTPISIIGALCRPAARKARSQSLDASGQGFPFAHLLGPSSRVSARPAPF
jgi:hypothetical protein